MSTLAILSQGGITGGSVTISTRDGSFTVPTGVQKIYVCGPDGSKFYARVTAGRTLIATQDIEVISDDSSQSCYWVLYSDLAAGSNSYSFDGVNVGDMGASFDIDIYWSNAINNYTGSAVDLTA